MKTFTKTYIGKGKQVNGIDVVKVTLRIEDVLKHKYEKEGAEYITFEVARLREADQYGRTHTAYVSVAEEPAPSTRKPRKKAQK